MDNTRRLSITDRMNKRRHSEFAVEIIRLSAEDRRREFAELLDDHSRIVRSIDIWRETGIFLNTTEPVSEECEEEEEDEDDQDDEDGASLRRNVALRDNSDGRSTDCSPHNSTSSLSTDCQQQHSSRYLRATERRKTAHEQ